MPRKKMAKYTKSAPKRVVYLNIDKPGLAPKDLIRIIYDALDLYFVYLKSGTLPGYSTINPSYSKEENIQSNEFSEEDYRI